MQTPNDAVDNIVEPAPNQGALSELIAAVEDSQRNLAAAHNINPSMLRDVMVNDVYEIIAELMRATEWFVEDLNGRLMNVEGDAEVFDSEFIVQMMQFVGATIEICKRAMEWAKEKGDEQALAGMQLLMAAAPAMINRLQEGLESVAESDEDDEGGEDDVVEPAKETETESAPEAPAAVPSDSAVPTQQKDDAPGPSEPEASVTTEPEEVPVEETSAEEKTDA